MGIKTLNLNDFRQLNQNKRERHLIKILSNPKIASLGNPFVFDSLCDVEHGFNARAKLIIDKMLPELGSNFLKKPSDGVFKPENSGIIETYGEEKERLFRIPFVYPRLNDFGDIKHTMFISLSGPNIEICDGDTSSYQIPEYCEYASVLRQGLKPEAYYGITNRTHDHGLNLLGHEAGLLPEPIFGNWEDAILDGIKKFSASKQFKFLALNFDATCIVSNAIPIAEKTINALNTINKPWFLMVNASSIGFSTKEDNAKAYAWRDIQKGTWDKLGVCILEKSEEELFYSKTKIQSMVAFTVVKP